MCDLSQEIQVNCVQVFIEDLEDLKTKKIYDLGSYSLVCTILVSAGKGSNYNRFFVLDLID